MFQPHSLLWYLLYHHDSLRLCWVPRPSPCCSPFFFTRRGNSSFLYSSSSVNTILSTFCKFVHVFICWRISPFSLLLKIYNLLFHYFHVNIVSRWERRRWTCSVHNLEPETHTFSSLLFPTIISGPPHTSYQSLRRKSTKLSWYVSSCE